jgi:NAD(P)-dependent dehydrogenase (short-subunit alcohol dehydrogenase family)
MARRDFSGKVILITGAAGGLGAALCHRFAAAGARIAAMDLDATRLQDLVAALPAGTLSIAGNIADPAACQAAIDQTVAHFGALDGLINNAGISHRSLFLDTDPAVIRRVMEVNFFGAMQMTHAALPHLIETRGAVAAISSVAGYAPLLGRAGYCASKHALLGFFDTLRSEVEDLGVGVTLDLPVVHRHRHRRRRAGWPGHSATSARITAGGESSPDDIAQRIVDALAQGRSLLLPDRTSRLAWWVHKFAPGFYARTMKRRVGAEFPTPSEETRS